MQEILRAPYLERTLLQEAGIVSLQITQGIALIGVMVLCWTGVAFARRRVVRDGLVRDSARSLEQSGTQTESLNP